MIEEKAAPVVCHDHNEEDEEENELQHEGDIGEDPVFNGEGDTLSHLGEEVEIKKYHWKDCWSKCVDH